MANIDPKTLDVIIKQTVSAVEKGKTQIYDIYEAASREVNKVKHEFEVIKQKTAEVISKVDSLERKERHSRLRPHGSEP